MTEFADRWRWKRSVVRREILGQRHDRAMLSVLSSCEIQNVLSVFEHNAEDFVRIVFAVDLVAFVADDASDAIFGCELDLVDSVVVGDAWSLVSSHTALATRMGWLTAKCFLDHLAHHSRGEGAVAVAEDGLLVFRVADKVVRKGEESRPCCKDGRLVDVQHPLLGFYPVHKEVESRFPERKVDVLQKLTATVQLSSSIRPPTLLLMRLEMNPLTIPPAVVGYRWEPCTVHTLRTPVASLGGGSRASLASGVDGCCHEQRATSRRTMVPRRSGLMQKSRRTAPGGSEPLYADAGSPSRQYVCYWRIQIVPEPCRNSSGSIGTAQHCQNMQLFSIRGAQVRDCSLEGIKKHKAVGNWECDDFLFLCD